jgi:hypothetical protein
MTDTPQHIYDLQLKGWLQKTPAERLLQLMKDNEALYLFWKHAKPTNNESNKVIITKNNNN